MVDPETERNFERAWHSYVESVKEDVLNDARKQAGGKPVTEPVAYRALDQYFRQIPPLHPTWRQGFGANLFLIVCIVMTLIFGLLSWQLTGSGDAATRIEGKAFLDMAQIFAGAVVGSAAGRGISRRREPR